MEIDHEIFSTVILSLSLIQEGSCQFLGKECAQYWLTARGTKPARKNRDQRGSHLKVDEKKKKKKKRKKDEGDAFNNRRIECAHSN